MEIDRDTDSYMIFTVNEILSKYKDAQLFLIIGSDMFCRSISGINTVK